MSNYIQTKIYLTDGQINKLKSEYKKNEDVTFQVDKTKTPNYDMCLTKTQVHKIKKGKRITVSKTQLKKNGRFQLFLIPLLTTLATGVLSGAAGSGNKKILDKVTGSGYKILTRGKRIYQNWDFPTK